MGDRTTIRRSVIRTYAAIAAGHHKKQVSEQRETTSKMATEIIKKEDWGPSPASFAFSILTVGLHLAVQYPVLQKRHRDKLLRVATSLSFKVMDAYITNIDQENGMIPAVANYIRDTLKKEDVTFVENELDKVVDIDDRLNEEEIEYMVAMVSILKHLTKRAQNITVDAVSAEARKRLIQMAQDNVTIEFENGGGLRQVEYREDIGRVCMRNIEKDEVFVENNRDLRRDSKQNVIKIAGTPEGQSLKIGSVSKVREVFVLQEKEVHTISTKKHIRGEWKPLQHLSDIDQWDTDCTARVWYMLLNHAHPEKYSFHTGRHLWALRPSPEGAQSSDEGSKPKHLIRIDTEISWSEMKCSPLQMKTSRDSAGREYVHPIGTTLKQEDKKITLLWDGEAKFEQRL